MKKLLHKIRLKLIHLLGGEIVLPLDKRPIKIIEHRPKIRTIVSCTTVENEGRYFIPIDHTLNVLALDIGRQIISAVGFQTSTEAHFTYAITAYRVKVDIIEGMDVREVSK